MQGLDRLASTFALLEYLILPIPLLIAAIYAVIDIGAPTWQRTVIPASIFAVPATFALSAHYPNSPSLQVVAMVVCLWLPMVASVVAFIWWSGYTSRRQRRRFSGQSNPPPWVN
jgi:hypothetical protein